MGLLAGALAAQPAPARVPLGAFFHATAGSHQEDLDHAADLTAFGLTTWVPYAYDQAQLDAWMRAAEAAGADLVFTFLGNVNPPRPAPEADDPNLDRLARVCRMTVEAEDSFALDVAGGPLLERVDDPAARYGVTAEGDRGNGLHFPAGAQATLATRADQAQLFWMRRCGVRDFNGATVTDPDGVRYRNETLHVRMRVDEESGPTLEDLRATSPDGVLARLRGEYAGHAATREIRVSDIAASGFAVFDLNVPFYRTPEPTSHLRFELEATGLAALVVDRFRFENARAGRLFAGEFDDLIAAQAAACSSPRCVRTYVNDEPHYVEWEAFRHVDSVLTARLGRRALTALYWGIDAEMVRRWAVHVGPSEILVDPYPLSGSPLALPQLAAGGPVVAGLPPYDPATYRAELQAAMDGYADDLAGSRRAARLAGRPLWLVLQAHGMARVSGNPEVEDPPADAPPPSGLGALAYRFRPPSPAESHAFGFLGVAYGAQAFFHFLYKSLDACGSNGCEVYVGLVGPNHERDVDRITYAGAAPLQPLWTGYDERWEAGRDLNGRLAAMVGALAGWESAATYLAADAPSGAYVGLVREGAAPAADVHVGEFRRAGVREGADARFIVVNRRCGPDDTRALSVILPASSAPRTVVDLETSRTVATLGAADREFTATFAPGDAHLYRVAPATPPRGAGLPAELALGRARPNPAAGPATLPLALPAASDVRLELYDALGRLVAVMHDGPMEAGYHDVRWDATSLPAGVYALRARVGDRTLSRLVTVAR